MNERKYVMKSQVKTIRNGEKKKANKRRIEKKLKSGKRKPRKNGEKKYSRTKEKCTYREIERESKPDTEKYNLHQ